MNALANESKFSALINAAVDAIFVISSTGIIEIANPAATRITGYSEAELVTQNIKLLMPPPHRDQHDGYIQHYLETGESKIIGVGREVKLQRKDGLIVQVYLSVGRFEADKEIKFVGILRDLSTLKQSETELIKTGRDLHNAQLEITELINRLAHASRISVMGEMASSLAHEVNQPLTAISNYSQACKRLLTSEPDQIEKITATLDKISTQALRANDIIQSMRSWVRNKDAVRICVDCNHLLREVANIADIEARSQSIKLELNLCPGTLNIMCDPVQIQQVALNLIRNSIEAISECGPSDSQQRRTIILQSKPLDEETVQVMVSDHGPGISDKVANQLFDPFVTTKKTGLGLGLSICKTITQIHGGKLYFRQNPDGGANFYFELPTALDS